MYTFELTKDIEAFNRFSEENGGSVYQSSYWATVKNAWKPYFYMGFRDGAPVLCCLCLERKIPLAGKLWYCPDGFVCDTSDAVLMREFCEHMKKCLKQAGAFAMVCDPLIVVRLNGTDVDFSAQAENYLKNGFLVNDDKGFYSVQPTTTINVPLVKPDSTRFAPEELLSKCEKGVRHGVKLGINNGLHDEAFTCKELENKPEICREFFSVMTEISDRVSFIQRTQEYYISIMNALGSHAVMDMIYYDRAEQRAKYEENLEKRAAAQELSESGDPKKAKQAAKLTEELNLSISRFESAENELAENPEFAQSDKIYLACGITSYFGNTSICLYGGTRNTLRNTLRPTHFLNWTRIERSIARGCAVHDMGRITGDAYDESNPLYGLCRYKQSYNGDITEYIGDMYLVSNRFDFMTFKKLLPFVKKVKNTVLKKTIKRHTAG